MDIKQLIERRRAISEAFHSFHQPLTSLHCGLEVTLLKQRSADEYRERIQEALAHAGAIFRLNSALRELVEATDPGEGFRPISARSVLTQVIEEVSVVAEPALVVVSAGEISDQIIAADPLKLLRMLGQVMATLVRDMAPSSSVKLTSRVNEEVLLLQLNSEGKRRETSNDNSLEMKLQAINFDAAQSYMQTLGGEFHVPKPGVVEIKLPLAK